MKFHDLAIGQRFELDGANYVKTSPVLASPEIGSTTRFMARYVTVRPLDGEQRAVKVEDKRTIPVGRACEAFDTYHSACCQMLASLEGKIPADSLEQAEEHLAAARMAFLAALES